MKRKRGDGGGSSKKVVKGSFEHKLERRRYLSQLVEEFEASETKLEAKEQVLANLANFAYDPYNYEFFKDLQVVQLFLRQVEKNSNDSKLLEFSLGALCNCAPDPSLGPLIISQGGVSLLKRHLVSSSYETSTESVVSCLTTLTFLMKYDTKTEIITTDLITHLNHLATVEDNRIKNIAKVFLQDFCQHIPST